jgi:hypothetical protein
MLSFKQIAMHCFKTEKEISTIFYNHIMYNGKILDRFEDFFILKDKQYYLKDKYLNKFQDLAASFIRVRYIGAYSLLGHTFTAYTNGDQKFFDVKEICDKFEICEYDFYVVVNFFDLAKSIVLNPTAEDKEPIHRLVTEHGADIILRLRLNNELKENSPNLICA